MGFLKDLDELLEKHYSKKQESCSCSKMQPVVPEMYRKRAIYTIGSPDPRAFVPPLSSFGGTDTKGYLLDPDDTRDAKEDISDSCIGWLQGVSFLKNSSEGEGSIVGILFDNMDEFYELLGKKKRLVLKAANEYGKIGILYDEVIKFEQMGWGMSIDDMVTEVSFLFSEVKEEDNE